jgi:hypothetical protein
MPVTDQTVLSEIQRVTLEGVGDGGATWPSGMWTQAEVLGYFNQRQNRFLWETGIRWTRAETNITISQADQAQPADWMATIFVAYKSSLGVYKELPKVDALELDFILSTWPAATATTPRGYYEIDGATLTTYVVPIPTDAGSALERYYVALGTTLTAAGVNLSVPDEFVPTIKYGVLAEMFGKVSNAYNAILLQMCEERWTEGVEIGKLQAPSTWFVL